MPPKNVPSEYGVSPTRREILEENISVSAKREDPILVKEEQPSPGKSNAHTTASPAKHEKVNKGSNVDIAERASSEESRDDLPRDGTEGTEDKTHANNELNETQKVEPINVAVTEEEKR